MKKLLILLVGVLYLSAHLVAQPLETLPDDPRILKGTLANGLSYYLVKNQALPGRADFYLVEKTGAALEEDGQAGMAAFLAQMGVRGSRNFPGTSMLDYFADLGLDIYQDFEIKTALEETIFRLSNVPVGRSAAVVDSTLLVLYNWSCSLNLDEEDVQQAKVFFRNEYATRDSAQYRMNRKLRQQLLEGTQYTHTLSSDLLKQVDEFSSKSLRKFYYQWSRPDLQALILVGDIDPQQVEMKIKTLFQTMPKAPAVIDRTYERPTLPGQLQVVQATDRQADQATLAFHFRNLPTPYELRNTAMPYLQDYLDNTTRFLIKERMERAKMNAGLPIWEEEVTTGRFLGIQNQTSLRLAFATLPDSLNAAVVWMARLLEQIRRDGFSEEEYARAHDHFFRDLDKRYQYRERTMTNRIYAERCIGNFLGGTTMASLELHHAYLHKADSLMTPELFNTYVTTLLRSPEDLTLAMTGPETGNYPDQTWINEALEVIAEMSTSIELVQPATALCLPELAQPDPLPALTLETLDPMSGATVLTFENGVTVLLKPTQADPGNFSFRAISKGGLSLLRNASPLQRDYMTSVANLCALGGISAQDLSTYNKSRDIRLEKQITYSLSALKGEAPVQEMEDFLKQVHLHFTAIQADEDAFRYFKEVEQARHQYADADPRQVLQDSLRTQLYTASRYTGISDSRDLETFDYNGAVQFLSRLYANAASYTFVIVGDIQPSALIPQLARYLGTLPTNPNRRDNWQVLPYYLNKMVRRVEIPWDSADTKAYYRFVLMGESPNTLDDRVIGQMISAVLNTELHQTLFACGLSPEVQSEFRKYPEEFLLIEADFEAERYDRTVWEKLDEKLAAMQQQGISGSELELIKRNLVTQFELNSAASCDFWMDLLISRYVFGKDFYSRYLSCLEQVSLEQFNDALRSYLKEGGRLEMVMYGNDNYSD